jgi:hypothetical protein
MTDSLLRQRKYRLPCWPASNHRWVTVGISYSVTHQQCSECGSHQTIHHKIEADACP